MCVATGYNGCEDLFSNIDIESHECEIMLSQYVQCALISNILCNLVNECTDMHLQALSSSVRKIALPLLRVIRTHFAII